MNQNDFPNIFRLMKILNKIKAPIFIDTEHLHALSINLYFESRVFVNLAMGREAVTVFPESAMSALINCNLKLKDLETIPSQINKKVLSSMKQKERLFLVQHLFIKTETGIVYYKPIRFTDSSFSRSIREEIDYRNRIDFTKLNDWSVFKE